MIVCENARGSLNASKFAIQRHTGLHTPLMLTVNIILSLRIITRRL